MTTHDEQKTNISNYRVSTRHYNFIVTVKKQTHPFHLYHIIVGDKSSPCLDSIIYLENNSVNTRQKRFEYTATLNNIKALKSCALEDISDDYIAKYSFGTELLEFLSFLINCQFSQIQTVKLTDDSMLWCNPDTDDRLDLLAYSIALHGKTWYEMKVNAYMLPQQKYEKYRSEVDRYMSKETKQNTNFMDVYNAIANNCSLYVGMVCNSIDLYEKIYNESETLPDFFRALNKTIPREDKCKFYRGWLPDFIYSHVRTIDRTWYFDLFPKMEYIEEPKHSITLQKTRRRKRNIRQI